MSANIRDDVIEECARVCDGMAIRIRAAKAKFTIHQTSLEEAAEQCEECAENIRLLKSS